MAYRKTQSPQKPHVILPGFQLFIWKLTDSDLAEKNNSGLNCMA